MKTYLIGIAAMGMVIGLLSGISESPIVSVLLPLLFALITAGGNLYVVWGQKADEQEVTSRIRSERARFIGSQLLTFSSTFVMGLWCGVLAKFNSETVWFVGEEQPAYVAFADGSPQTVKYLRYMDITLSRDGASLEQRQKILKSLVEKQEQWKDEAEEVLGQTETEGGGGYSPEFEKRRIPIPGPPPRD